jgi:predicted nucleotidyltransferase
MSSVLHTTLSRKGGQVRSPAKTVANRAKIAAFWADVRAGRRAAPHRPRTPPPIEAIARLLAPICQKHGITRLEIFGSAARGESRRGSDVDVIATFREHPGLGIVEIEQSMSQLLGVPVDLLTHEAVEEMANPFRRESILRDRMTIYAA